MRRAGLLLTVSCVLALATGCAGAHYRTPVRPPAGWVYAHVRGPVSTNFGAEGTAYSMRKGKATSENFLGLFATGDASVQAAAEAGGIKNIRYVDYEFCNLLGLYSTFTTIVYGD